MMPRLEARPKERQSHLYKWKQHCAIDADMLNRHDCCHICDSRSSRKDSARPQKNLKICEREKCFMCFRVQIDAQHQASNRGGPTDASSLGTAVHAGMIAALLSRTTKWTRKPNNFSSAFILKWMSSTTQAIGVARLTPPL
jgi:hypothetical protein